MVIQYALFWGDVFPSIGSLTQATSSQNSTNSAVLFLTARCHLMGILVFDLHHLFWGKCICIFIPYILDVRYYLTSNLGMIDVIFPLIGLLRRGNLSLHDGKWWSTILPAFFKHDDWKIPEIFKLPAMFDDTRHGLRVGCIRDYWLVWKSCIHVYPKINCWTHWVQLWPLTVIYIFLKKLLKQKVSMHIHIYIYIYVYIYIYTCAHHYKQI